MGHKGQDPEPNGLTFLGLDPFGHEKSQEPGTANEPTARARAISDSGAIMARAEKSRDAKWTSVGVTPTRSRCSSPFLAWSAPRLITTKMRPISVAAVEPMSV
jgi:hypothetical protein